MVSFKESFAGKVLSALAMLSLVIAPVAGLNPSVAEAATIFSESFGTGSTGSLPSGWSDGGNSGSDAEARAAGSGNDSASANGGRFGIAFGENGWFCRMITTTGYSNVQLSYQWRGDDDAESSDDGIVEIRTTSGSSCTSSTGWTTLATHDLSQDNSWTTQAPITHSGMNNATFALRFRVDSSQGDEHFRVDGISITGDTGDTTAPTVTNVTSSTANGSYNAGDVVNVQVTFSEVVLVTGTPRITLETGATDRNVNYMSGSNSTTLTFAYTVQAGDTSGDLDYTSTSALALNGGTIRDAASNNAVLTLVTPGSANSLGANKAIVIDTTAPTVAQVTPVPTPTNDSTPNYTFSSNEAGSVTYTGGCTSGTANAVNGNNTVTFAMLADGTYGSCTIKVTDAAGNQSNTLAVSSFTVDTIAPVITITGDNPMALGTGDSYSELGATALDANDGSVAANPSGSVNTGTPGTYNITYTAVDAAGNSATAIRAVNVSDDDAPTFAGVPSNMTIEATSASGAVVTYVNPTVSDNVDGDVSANVVCAPASGNTFAFGTTVVSCTVSDAAGNDAATSFNVTVVDTTDPILTMPANQTLEATAPGGAVATFTVTASDNIDGDVSSSIVCDALSGNMFAIGVMTVSCTAEDNAGNTGSGSFTIMVQDTTAPVITFDPAAVTVFVAPEATEGQANFSVMATDIADTTPTVVCTPASGSMLPIGITMVSCTATDVSGNSSVATLPVTVRVYNTTTDSTDVSPFEVITPTPEVPAVEEDAGTPAPVENAAVTETANEAEGEVLGASCIRLTSYVGMGNDVPEDVMLVQQFLNKELGLTIEVTGTYDDATREGVNKFQLKYIADILAPWIPFGHDGKTPTGKVYKTTQHMMNVLSCPGLEIEKPILP